MMTRSMRGIFTAMIFNKATIGFNLDSFLNCCFHTSLVQHASELSAEKVTEILRSNEFFLELKDEKKSVEFYESNQLPSNSPMEDTRSEAKCLLSRGLLFGVFDGHGGPACAQVLAKRLFDYICANLLPKDMLRQYSQSLDGKGPPMDLLEKYNETFDLLPELNLLYRKSFAKYVHNLLLENSEDHVNTSVAMERAMLSLDDDISTEALNCEIPEVSALTMQIAMSGSVGCIAHVDGSDLHVANVGDCRAVLGVLTEDNVWKAKPLTLDHSDRNKNEIKRIYSEHPASETNTVLKMGRLLGVLAPLRAFGDFSYKWSREVLSEIVKADLPLELVQYVEEIKWKASCYLTPPYLTAKPDISHHKLTSSDKFLIIATDGLWDEVSSEEAVRLVASHLRGKVLLDPLKVPEECAKLGHIHSLLQQRKRCFDVKPIDRNGATHLLRNALGSRVNDYLAVSKSMSRLYRDDITIIIVYFDTTYPR